MLIIVHPITSTKDTIEFKGRGFLLYQASKSNDSGLSEDFLTQK